MLPLQAERTYQQELPTTELEQEEGGSQSRDNRAGHRIKSRGGKRWRREVSGSTCSAKDLSGTKNNIAGRTHDPSVVTRKISHENISASHVQKPDKQEPPKTTSEPAAREGTCQVALEPSTRVLGLGSESSKRDALGPLKPKDSAPSTKAKTFPARTNAENLNRPLGPKPGAESPHQVTMVEIPDEEDNTAFRLHLANQAKCAKVPETPMTPKQTGPKWLKPFKTEWTWRAI